MENKMSLGVFKLEEYLSHHEFSAPYLLCCSDAESFSMQEILDLASESELALWNNLRLGYTEAKGLPLLRQTIQKQLYPSLRDEQILVFCGAEEGIFCGLFALCEPGDHAIVLGPCYQSLAEIPKMKGVDVSVLSLKESNEWRIDLNEIKRAMRTNTKVLVMNFPHNPTGKVMDQSELEEVIALCREHDVWLFSDEVYRLLGSPKKPWATPAATKYEKALSLGVMSKALGLAGLRIGWVACQNVELLAAMERIKYYTSICCSGPAEILSVIALNNQERLLKRNNQIVSDNLRMLDEFFAEFHEQFGWVRPEGGCVGFVHYKGHGSVEDFTENVRKKTGVLLMPASVYDTASSHFRVGFGRKNMPEALSRLRAYMQETTANR